MKTICIKMDLQEKVLDSYLIRVFKGELVTQKTSKTVRFPEENLASKYWTIQMLKNFCGGCVSYKLGLKMYKARLIKKK